MRVSRREHIRADDQPAAPAGRLVGYARVSTPEQSIDLQVQALLKAGVHPDNIHSETVSGVSKRRPALRAAFLDARKGDTFVVWKLDRVGRSLLDLLAKLQELDERGIGFRSLTEGIDTTTAGGRLIMQVMGALAEFERGLIVERTIAGVLAAKARGVRFGQPEKLNETQKREARRMRREGATAEVIAKHFGVSKQTIYVRAFGRAGKKR